jgi:radical SAM-linked protein
MRVRIGYRKIGRAAYTSHLDLVRTFPRMLRRVGLPLYYSEGFRPLARMTFGPALPVGTPSLCEHVDVRLRAAESPNLEDLCNRLNEVALEGIEIFGYRVLRAGDAALNRVIEATQYVAALSGNELADLGITEEEQLRALLDRRPEGLHVDRDIRGVKKRVSITPALLDVRVGQGSDALRHAGIRGDLWPVAITLRTNGKTTPRPGEVLRALTGFDDLSPRVVRSQFFAMTEGGRATPLELEALRNRGALQAAE